MLVNSSFSFIKATKIPEILLKFYCIHDNDTITVYAVRLRAQVNLIQVEACICAMAFIKWKYLCIIKQIANRDNVWLLSTRETDDDSLRGICDICVCNCICVCVYVCVLRRLSLHTEHVLPSNKFGNGNENGNLVYLYPSILFASFHFVSFRFICHVCLFVCIDREWQRENSFLAHLLVRCAFGWHRLSGVCACKCLCALSTNNLQD